MVRVSASSVREGASLLWLTEGSVVVKNVQEVDVLTGLSLGSTPYVLQTTGAANATSALGDVTSTTGLITIGTSS